MSFKDFLEELKEETTSGDIATVDTKLDLVKRDKRKINDEYLEDIEDEDEEII